MCFINAIYSAVVGNHEPFKAPLAAQNIAQQKTVIVARDPVNGVVGRHNRTRTTFDKTGAEWFEKSFPEHPPRIVRSIRVVPPVAVIIHKMLGRGNDSSLLQRFGVGYTHTRAKENIFAITFFGTAPTRVTRNIDHRRQNLTYSHRP